MQGNPLWGAPAVTSAPSLAQIQHQEERRHAYDQRMRELQAQRDQQQLQQQHARAAPSWGDRPASTGNSAVQSFLEIQEEEARRLAKIQHQQRAQQHQQQQQQQLSKSQVLSYIENEFLIYCNRAFGGIVTSREVPCHGPGSFVLRLTTRAVKDFSSLISVRRPALDDSQAKLNA